MVHGADPVPSFQLRTSKMFWIGNVKIQNPLVLAPMEEITDIPFRVLSRRRGAGFVITEFTSGEALIRNIPKTLRKIRFLDAERPVAVQLFGSKPDVMAEAARIIAPSKPDVIDINCGCWNKNHALRGEGAGLLRDPDLMERVIRAVVAAVDIPVTVKTRLGWDARDIRILDIARMVEQTGAKALSLHCRTRCQGYKGQAQWQWLEQVKRIISIPLIGNGDVKTPQAVQDMLATGCDGVMIGRAALSNPWIFRETLHYLATGQALPPPLLQQRVADCIEHLCLAVRVRGMNEGIVRFRKYYAGYLRDLPHAAKLRIELMAYKELQPIIDRLRLFAESQPAVCLSTS